MINHDDTKAADVLTDRAPNDNAAVIVHVLESARRVQRVSREINEFLAAQFEALEQALHRQQADRAGRARSLAEREELSRQRAQMEREQRAALEKLEAERASLAEAWQRLEADQRKLLADRAACDRTQRSAAGATAVGHVMAEAGIGSPHSVSSQPSVVSSPVVPDKSANQELERAVRESVLMQFQQLKNDVRSHARRRNSR